MEVNPMAIFLCNFPEETESEKSIDSEALIRMVSRKFKIKKSQNVDKIQ